MSDETIPENVKVATDGDGTINKVSSDKGVFNVITTATGKAYDAASEFVSNNGQGIAGGLIGRLVANKLGGSNAAAAAGVAIGAATAEYVFNFFTDDGDEVSASDIDENLTDEQLAAKQAELKESINGAEPSDLQKIAESANTDGTLLAQLAAPSATSPKPEPDPVYANDLIALGDTHDFRTTLTSQLSGERIIFHVSPNVDESRSATYDTISPLHFPGSIQVYKTTNARAININGKFIARNTAEAARTIEYMNLIRSWVMPYYGEGTSEKEYTSKRLGAPPDILVLRAYGKKNMEYIPVVLSSYSWTYPDDVDYIPTEFGESCPRIIDVSLTLMETYSPEEYGKFDLTEYKLGNLGKAFGTIDTEQRANVWKDMMLTHRNRNIISHGDWTRETGKPYNTGEVGSPNWR